MNLSTHNPTFNNLNIIFRSLNKLSKIQRFPLYPSRALHIIYIVLMHYLNNFRKKPAMSEFD